MVSSWPSIASLQKLSVFKGNLPWLTVLLSKKSNGTSGLSGEGSSAPGQGPPSDPKVNQQLGKRGTPDEGGGQRGYYLRFLALREAAPLPGGTLPSDVGDGSCPP